MFLLMQCTSSVSTILCSHNAIEYRYIKQNQIILIGYKLLNSCSSTHYGGLGNIQIYHSILFIYIVQFYYLSYTIWCPSKGLERKVEILLKQIIGNFLDITVQCDLWSIYRPFLRNLILHKIWPYLCSPIINNTR